MIHPEFTQWCSEYERQLRAQGWQKKAVKELMRFCAPLWETANTALPDTSKRNTCRGSDDPSQLSAQMPPHPVGAHLSINPTVTNGE